MMIIDERVNIKSGGVAKFTFIFSVYCIAVGSNTFLNWWLSHWTGDEPTSGRPGYFYFSIYIGIACMSLSLSLLSLFLLFSFSLFFSFLFFFFFLFSISFSLFSFLGFFFLYFLFGLLLYVSSSFLKGY